MKHSHIRFTTSVLIGAFATAGLFAAPAESKGAASNPNKPTVITPPAVKDGTAEARAPFPASRQFDETKSPSQKALENAPTSTPATEPPLAPPSNVRVRVEKPGADPALLPTGRATASVAAALDSATFAPTLRATTIGARDHIFTDLESRMTAAEAAVGSIDKSAREMSAEGREKFKAASNEVKEKSKALRKSVQAARKASANEWDNARTQLAADYDAYAAALARIDAVAGIPPAP